MIDKDIVYAKISSIQRCLRRIKDVTNLEPETLDDIDVQDIVTLNLQRAIQGVIDLAAHVVAEEGLGIVHEIRENFELLFRKGILTERLSGRLKKMVGFRNIAVHEYQTISVDILKSILQHNLKDIEEFYHIVVKYYGLTES